MKRKVNKIVCKICNNEYSTVGFFGHLRDTHKTSPDEYVKVHGEYRTKALSLKGYESSNSHFECLLDGKKFKTERMLSGHIKRSFSMSKDEYVKNIVFKDGFPKCKCGCGDDVGVIKQYPYKREYISGHNSVGETNPMFGKCHQPHTLKIMSEKATERIEEFKSSGGKILPMNTVCMMHKKEFSDKIQQRVKENYIDYLFDGDRLKGKVTPLFQKSNYIGQNEKYDFQCVTCKDNFVSDLSGGKIPKCPNCFLSYKSYTEYEIFEFINNTFPNILIKRCDRSILNGLELDIYIPEKKIAIEFDGIYWHSELNGKNRSYHLNKTIQCEKQGIRLIHIFENEWNFSREIVESKLTNILGKRKESIFARKCVIKVPTHEEKLIFLNKNHIQGNDISKIFYGLYNKDKLMSVITFGHRRINMGGNFSNKDEYELYRYATDINYNIVGGFSKLLTHFIKNNNPKKITTYADRRWSSKNNMYEKTGFEFVSTSDPSYWYFEKNNPMKLFYRYQFRKTLLKTKLEKFDLSISEWDNMKNNGYDRIWDCGHFKYELSV